jgi:hypothetical protein
MTASSDDDMRDDYSELFATQTPVRGMYYERAMRAKRLVQLDEDLLKAFPTNESVNAALHRLVEASRFVHVERQP